MKSLPSLLILADRGHLVAYQTNGSGHLQRLETAEFEEAHAKFADIVTDQAGAFPVTGSVGTSAAERLPMEEELQTRNIRHVAKTINAIVDRVKPDRWAFAAPSEINRAILKEVGDERQKTLYPNLRKDLTNLPLADIEHYLKNTVKVS